MRFTDKDGRAVRQGLSGEFQINEPYQAQDVLEGSSAIRSRGASVASRASKLAKTAPRLIELVPTTKTGEVVLTFQLNDRQRQEVRVWLTPGKRDWILVGFAQGTFGHKQLSGNHEALKDANADDKLFDESRLAFYAKGEIKGEYLLTLAYDSAKERGLPNRADATVLRQAIDPNQFYTLYADATDPQFDAASTRKLYLRIEKAQFYALFGDYDTGLTVTELSRYSRTLNGIKSEYQGKTVRLQRVRDDDRAGVRQGRDTRRRHFGPVSPVTPQHRRSIPTRSASKCVIGSTVKSSSAPAR